MDVQPTILGVDFSGANDPGEEICLAKGTIENDILEVADLQSAADAFDADDRTGYLCCLREHVNDLSPCVVGLDFPFAVASEATEADTWDSFVDGFGDRYDDPDHFRSVCQEQADGKDRRRRTEAKHDGLCAYNHLIRKQTFYGIREMIVKLRGEGAAVLPMEDPTSADMWLLETYPAGTLDDLELHRDGYKRSTRKAFDRRIEILDQLRDEGVEIEEEDAKYGLASHDALDALVAAFATKRAFESDPTDVECCDPEGHIYV